MLSGQRSRRDEAWEGRDEGEGRGGMVAGERGNIGRAGGRGEGLGRGCVRAVRCVVPLPLFVFHLVWFWYLLLSLNLLRSCFLLLYLLFPSIFWFFSFSMFSFYGIFLFSDLSTWYFLLLFFVTHQRWALFKALQNTRKPEMQMYCRETRVVIISDNRWRCLGGGVVASVLPSSGKRREVWCRRREVQTRNRCISALSSSIPGRWCMRLLIVKQKNRSLSIWSFRGWLERNRLSCLHAPSWFGNLQTRLCFPLALSETDDGMKLLCKRYCRWQSLISFYLQYN